MSNNDHCLLPKAVRHSDCSTADCRSCGWHKEVDARRVQTMAKKLTKGKDGLYRITSKKEATHERQH